jgi:hypothetical protein
MNKKPLYFSLTILGVVLSGISSGGYAYKSNAIATPKDQASCQALGGRWGAIGIFPAKVCNLPTKDAGKVCSDSSECDGDCIAELSKAQLEQAMRFRATFHTNGKCTAWKMVLGCKPVVRNGTVKGLLCRD